MTTLIHPTAVIHPGAELHPTVQVGAYAVIGEHVKVRAGTIVGHHVVIEGKTDIGERNHFFPGAAIGLEPQDLKYDGSLGPLKIGNGNQIREFVTIHRPTHADEVTSIGNGNLLMAYTHVGHNCVIEDQVIISNSVALAGHVHIESKARISGVLGVHQFVRIGRYAMVGGMARIDRDVPPYMVVEGNPSRIRALHKIGMQRSGFSAEDLQLLGKAFQILYRSGLRLTEALDHLELLPDNEHVHHLRQFIQLSILPERRGLTPALSKGSKGGE
jgi:UDP-N-acetylglucosamine acyltransferase